MEAASAHSLGRLTREGPFHSSFPCHPPTCLLTTTTELCPLACSPVHRRRRGRRPRLRLSTRCVAACRPRVRHQAPIGWQRAQPPRMQDSLWRRAPLARLGVREVILFNGRRARVVNTFIHTHYSQFVCSQTCGAWRRRRRMPFPELGSDGAGLTVITESGTPVKYHFVSTPCSSSCLVGH